MTRADGGARARALVAAAALVMALASLAFVAGCRRQAAPAPKLPAGVPAQAFWVGGSDGGVFVLLEGGGRAAAPPIRGRVFHPDGTIWFAGTFVPEPAGISVDVGDHAAFTGWDGARLLLTEGRALRATPPP